MMKETAECGVNAILAILASLTCVSCLPVRLLTCSNHSLPSRLLPCRWFRSKYIQSAASDAGWLLVSQPGSLGTAFHADRKIGTAVPRSDLERVLLGFFHGFFLASRIVV
jgi:hypothetical protein